MLSEQQPAREVSNHPEPSLNEPTVYQIRVKGHLGSGWTEWFEGLTIALQENGDTLLTGPLIDQSALYGLLKKVRDLGVTLLSVNPVQCTESDLEIGNEQ